MAYLCDKQGLFRHGDKVAGRNYSAVGLYPADKSLHAHNVSCCKVYLGLIIEHQLIVVYSLCKLPFYLVALNDRIMGVIIKAEDRVLGSVGKAECELGTVKHLSKLAAAAV